MARFPLGRYTGITRQKMRTTFSCAIQKQFGDLVASAPVDTSELVSSGTFGRKFGTPTSVGQIIEFTADHAGIQDAGTGPYKISVRNARILSDGTNFFGTEVDHPGSTENQGWFSDVATQANWEANLKACSGR